LTRTAVRRPAAQAAENATDPTPPAGPDPVWRLGAAVVGQTALFASLLLFFGWARTKQTFGYFGVDLSLLQLSTTDYVLRSVNSAYNPLLRVGLIVLLAVWLHGRVSRGAGRSDVLARRLRLGTQAAGGVLLAIGISALLWSRWSDRLGGWLPQRPALVYAWLPAMLTAGIALVLYGRTLPVRPGVTTRIESRLTFVLVALLVLALFWLVSLLAVYDGQARAVAIARGLPDATQVVLLAQDDLDISGPGVTESALAGPRYRRQFTGLRLLIHSGGKYFVLPSGWQWGRDRVYEIPDDGRVRIELIAR
jgi:hypothetical protein